LGIQEACESVPTVEQARIQSHRLNKKNLVMATQSGDELLWSLPNPVPAEMAMHQHGRIPLGITCIWPMANNRFQVADWSLEPDCFSDWSIRGSWISMI